MHKLSSYSFRLNKMVLHQCIVFQSLLNTYSKTDLLGLRKKIKYETNVYIYYYVVYCRKHKCLALEYANSFCIYENSHRILKNRPPSPCSYSHSLIFFFNKILITFCFSLFQTALRRRIQCPTP